MALDYNVFPFEPLTIAGKLDLDLRLLESMLYIFGDFLGTTKMLESD